MNRDQLLAGLTDNVAPIRAEALSETTYRIHLPTYRNVHDSIAVSLSQINDAWVISDAGQSRFLLGEDFTRVIDAMECAGAEFSEGNRGALDFVIEDEDDIVESVLTFAYYITALPAVWHALDCVRGGRDDKPASVDLMARETKTQIVARVGEERAHLVQLKMSVTGHNETFAAPLAIGYRGSKRRPRLVASFIDTTAPKSALTAAKRNTSFLFEIIRDWNDTPKYVVVRGTEDSVAHYADFYGDQRNVTTISTEEPGAFYEDAADSIQELVSP